MAAWQPLADDTPAEVEERQGDEAGTQRILVLFVDDRGDLHVELPEGGRRIALVEFVDRAIVAQQPLDNAIALR